MVVHNFDCRRPDIIFVYMFLIGYFCITICNTTVKNFETFVVGSRQLVKNTGYPAFKAYIDRMKEHKLRSIIFLDDCPPSRRSEIIIELCKYIKEN